MLEVTRPQIQTVVGLRNQMASELAGRGVECLPGTATFYLFASLGRSRLNSDQFATTLLRDKAVSVVPGLGYGASCDRFARISVGTEPVERLRRGIHAFADLVEETS